MGVVYRATDTRLDRAVAIKVLPEALRGDADRLRRFEQEARTIGGLNHPNLVTLHDVGRHDEVPYLVTELLDGQSLRAKLADGALPVRESIRIATEIARGLAAAHGAGIVHRDIKPDNVFVTGDGRVKILDFGIAKLQKDTPADLGNAPTLGGTAATGTGVVIGTPGYMAPEQLASAEIDARTDVFAFGVVLYEMLARKRPFAAATGVEESYAIVKTPPPPLGDDIPPALERIVMRCLEKRREARFQSAADLAFALDALDNAPSGITTVSKRDPVVAPSGVTTVVTPIRRSRTPIVVIAGLAIAGATVMGVVKLTQHTSRPPITVSAPARSAAWPSLVEGGPVYHRITFKIEPKWFARFSPDGKSVMYSVRTGVDYQVVRSEITRANVVPVADAVGRLLDVSPSGVLALRQRMPDKPGGLLVTLSEGQGAPRQITENVHDATFVGEELAIVRDKGNGMVIELPIGTELAHRDGIVLNLLRASFDGKMLAVAEHPIATDSRGYVVILDTKGRELSRSAPHSTIDGLAWGPDGQEVWMSTEAGLQALDLHSKERVLMRSPGDLFLRDVRHDTGWMLMAPRDLRVRAYAHHAGKQNDDYIGWRMASVATVSRDGSMFALLDGTGIDETPEGYQLYVRNGTQTPVAIDHGFDIALVPDGSRAVLLCRAGDPLRIVPTTAKGGTRRAVPVAGIARFDYSARLEMSADGKRVYALAAEKDKPLRVWSFDLEGSAAPTPIGPDHIDLPNDDQRALYRFAVSPDGKWLALPAGAGVRLVATSGKAELALPAEHEETPIGFTDDGALFVWRTHGWPRPIMRVELAPPHKRTEMMAFDPLEHPDHVDAVIDGTGKTIGYDWLSISSDLFVLEPPGVK
jgi:serine/threonine protein kinase